MINVDDDFFIINPVEPKPRQKTGGAPLPDPDFVLTPRGEVSQHFAPIPVRTKQTQPTSEEAAKLKEYINFIAGEGTNLTLDAVVKKLADQWRAAAWKIATAMRLELLQQNWLKDTNWHNEPLSTARLVEIGRSYGIPFCIYHMGTTNNSGHYVILTSVPEKKTPTDEAYTIHAYDPLRGEIEFTLTESQLTQVDKLTFCNVNTKPIKHGVFGKDLMLAQIERIIAETNGYDLGVPRYDDVKELSLAKMQPLQNKDGFNCGLWCLIYAMTTMAYQRGENIFKKMGIQKIADLCQVALVTPETG